MLAAVSALVSALVSAEASDGDLEEVSVEVLVAPRVHSRPLHQPVNLCQLCKPGMQIPPYLSDKFLLHNLCKYLIR